MRGGKGGGREGKREGRREGGKEGGRGVRSYRMVILAVGDASDLSDQICGLFKVPA